MPNFVPFLTLGAASLVTLIVLLIRFRSFWPGVLSLSYAGMIYIFELFIYVIFDSYEYAPHIFRIRYYDSTFGAIFSNMLAVPVVAAVIATTRLRNRWIFLFAFGFGGIEWLFIHWKVYELHWWRIWYTVPTLIFFFWFAKLWLRKLRAGRAGFVFVSLWMVAWSLSGTFLYLLAVIGVRTFRPGVFEQVYRDDIFAAAMYGIFIALILSWVVDRYRGLWPKLGGLAIVLAVNLLLIRLGVLRLHVPLWKYWLLFLLCVVPILWLVRSARRELRRLAIANAQGHAESER